MSSVITTWRCPTNLPPENIFRKMCIFQHTFFLWVLNHNRNIYIKFAPFPVQEIFLDIYFSRGKFEVLEGTRGFNIFSQKKFIFIIKKKSILVVLNVKYITSEKILVRNENVIFL